MNACPKCGAALRLNHDTQTWDESLRQHVYKAHADAIGTARAIDREDLRFCYMRPIEGTTEPWWYVILLDGPALVTRFRPASWSITWWQPVTAELSRERGTVQA